MRIILIVLFSNNLTYCYLLKLQLQQIQWVCRQSIPPLPAEAAVGCIERLDVVWDTYVRTRQFEGVSPRNVGKRRVRRKVSGETKLLCNWMDFLHDSMNKRKPFAFLTSKVEEFIWPAICVTGWSSLPAASLWNLERLAVILYDKTSPLNCINEAGRVLFCQKNRAKDKLPPTKDALLQHVRRSA